MRAAFVRRGRSVALVVVFTVGTVLAGHAAPAAASITAASLTPTSGPYGTLVTAHFSGTGVTPSYQFVLWFGEMSGTFMVDGTGVATFMTQADGTFTADVTFTVPTCAPISSNGGHTVVTRVLAPGPWAAWPSDASTPPPFGPAGTPPTFTITSPEATSCATTPPGTFVVTNTADSGAGSLREAIHGANAYSGGPRTIVFNIPASDPGFNGRWFTISPLTPWEALGAGATTIDGTTQTAFAGDTNPSGPEIFVDGRSLAPSKPGFRLQSANNVIEGLTVSGFPNSAIDIHWSGNVVRGNYIGTDPTGRSAIENDSVGCCPAVVDQGVGTIIGGAGPGEGNLISGNHGPGLGLAVGSHGVIVQGNRIGTDATGSYAIPNGSGVLVGGPNVGGDAYDAIIGGTSAGAGNLISGNAASGIEISGSGHVVQGNFIGTDVTGTRAIGNGSDPTLGHAGLRILGASHVLVGGLVPGARNVISGNTAGNAGLWIGGAASENTVQGNYIGTDVTGTAALGNREGIFFKILSTVMADNVIGGRAPGAGNVISGNLDRGIRLGGTRTRVEGNLIGTNASGTGPIPNFGDGVRAASACDFNCDAIIVGNTIAYSAGPGIATNNGHETFTITRNAIFANGQLGIDLGGDGVTPNDPGDIDTGPNMLQNFPVIGTTETSGGSVTVTGGLDTQNAGTATVELFDNDAADPSGYGEGQRYATSVTPGANGCFTATFPASGGLITSTATDAAGNTSEFSRAIPQGTTKAAIALTPATATNVVGRTHTVDAVLTNTAGGPVPCADLAFIVSGANHASGSATTDINGHASFTYTGMWAGTDTITGTSGGVSGTASKTWTFPTSTLGKATGGGSLTSGSGTAAFGFTADSAKGQLELNDWALAIHGDVAATVIAGSHATVYGYTRTGAQFRIDADDNGEPGTNDHFAIVTSDGYSISGALTAGNVQVH